MGVSHPRRKVGACLIAIRRDRRRHRAAGFLITGDPVYVEPYQGGIATVHGALDQIASPDADNPTQIRISVLRPAVDCKLAILAQTLDAERTGGFEAAERTVQTNVGESRMDRVRAIVADMDHEEAALLQTRRAQSAGRFWIAIATEAAVGLVALALLAVIINVSGPTTSGCRTERTTRISAGGDCRIIR
jgi:CHASE3 domain sensor protein